MTYWRKNIVPKAFMFKLFFKIVYLEEYLYNVSNSGLMACTDIVFLFCFKYKK